MMMMLTQTAESVSTHDQAEGYPRLGPTERRRGLRIQQTRPIKIYLPHAARFVGGQTHDISATGLRLELPRSAPVETGKLLNVHVGLDDQGSALANRKQMIPARVVWVERDDQGKSSRLVAGIEFLASITARANAA